MEKILNVIYNVLLAVVSPFFFASLFILNLNKNKKSEGYLYKFFPDAFKSLQEAAFEEGVWIHAVSLGEMRAAVKFIDLLKSEYGRKIYLSATTKTGFDFAYNIYKNDESVLIFYFPYDFLFSLRGLLKLVNPSLFSFMSPAISEASISNLILPVLLIFSFLTPNEANLSQ